MSDVRIKLNYAGIRELLHSDEIAASVMEAADGVRSRAGAGHETEAYSTAQRRAVRVIAATDAAAKENQENNTLLKALG